MSCVIYKNDQNALVAYFFGYFFEPYPSPHEPSPFRRALARRRPVLMCLLVGPASPGGKRRQNPGWARPGDRALPRRCVELADRGNCKFGRHPLPAFSLRRGIRTDHV